MPRNKERDRERERLRTRVRSKTEEWKAYHRVWGKKNYRENLDESRKYQREFKQQWRKSPENLAKEKAASKKYREANSERLKAAARARYKERMQDPEYRAYRRDAGKKYQAKHPEAYRRSIDNWREKNIEHVRQWWRLNQHKRRTAAGILTQEKWIQRLEYYGRCCSYCGNRLDTKVAEIDHVIPIVDGGSNWPSNLVPSCRKCNCRKNSRRWLPRQPRPHGPLPD